ncbi:MAG: TonB-dependent receptor [Saprospiraceae bacterium]|nr:TonB-dependent receptor [Saprospiraceae bacterium]
MKTINLKQLTLIFISLFFGTNQLMSQTIISGTITDQESKEGLMGVSIMVEDKVTGTVTDLDGYFSIITNERPPFNLDFSMLGFESRTVNIITSGQEVNLEMSPQIIKSEEVVVAASRVEESIMKAPVTIEKLGLQEIRSSGSFDAYSGLANLKGVQMNTSSLTFSSINTRGFADVQNFRFIQLLDGVEMNSPGLNYPSGTIAAPSDIDVLSMELVPGAGSALYGANAFNGMLLMNTKNPFYYQGLSAEIKGGITMQGAGGIQPFGEVGFRYAHAFNDKFAFKITGSALAVHDWVANDESYHVTNDVILTGAPILSADDPNFQAVHRYGDEVAVPVFLGDTTMNINRTGIAERDIIDYNQQLFKANAALHYRISENVELIYDFRFLHTDAVLRHTTIYPLKDLQQYVHKLELRNNATFFRAYYSMENAGNSSYLLGTGAYIQEGLKSSADWSADYSAAYRGQVPGVDAQDHTVARAYADSDIPGRNSDLFQTLRANTLANPDLLTGGSKLVDRTSFIHAEGNYDFTPIWDIVSFQLGGSFRRYNLVSEGHLFNDGADGFNKPIGIMEYGAYLQASKTLFKDILTLRASARVDKNQNFKLRVTPRASAVVSFGKERKHNIRFSYQTGFRNPASQETYIALDLGQVILLGGVEDNINNYTYTLLSDNPLTGASAGTTVNGADIVNGLVTLSSFGAFSLTNDPNVLVASNISRLEQEKITSFDFGYKALIGKRIYLDLNGYYNIYDDFVTRVLAFSPETFRAYSVYTNIDDQIISYGGSIGLDISLPKKFNIGANYTFTTFDASTAEQNNPEFLPSFNTPQHRANFSFSNLDVWKGLGFNIKYRWSDSYLWQSPFGQNTIESYHVLDAAITYKMKKIGTLFKIGGTNLLNQEYRQIYGGPNIGSQFYVGITYDPLMYKGYFKRKKGGGKKDKKDKNKKDKDKGKDGNGTPGHTRF